MDVRQGKLEDLDHLVRLGLAAMPKDPQWDYRYPKRKEFPDEHREWTAKRWERFFHKDPDGGTWVVCFIAGPVCQGKDNQGDQKLGDVQSPPPVSFAVWHFPPEENTYVEHPPSNVSHSLACSSDVASTLPSPPHHANRQDWNQERMQAVRKAISSAKKELFDSKYGKKQIHLQILGTHPTFWRRGAATKLLKWGIKKAEEKTLPITLFASPMGQNLYRKMQFESYREVTIKADGERESITVCAMAYDPRRNSSKVGKRRK